LDGVPDRRRAEAFRRACPKPGTRGVLWPYDGAEAASAYGV